MRKGIKKIALCLPGIFLIAGCAALQKEESPTLAVVPSQSVRHGIARAEAQYALGRYYRGQARADEAIAAFRKALQADPEHAEARNALGVMLAGLGRNDEAIEELERAVDSAPRSAVIRNNLGYAYLLRGRAVEAVAALEMAAALDPASPRVRDNLQQARVAVSALAEAAPGAGPEAPPVVTVAVPETIPAAPLSVASDAAQVATPAMAPAVAPAATQAATQAAISAASPAVTQAVTQAVTPVVAPVVAPVATRVALATPVALPPDLPAVARDGGRPVDPAVGAVAPDSQAGGRPSGAAVVRAGGKPRLEVANGNGAGGMARSVAQRLQREGYARARLTNEPGFAVRKTLIQYRPGFEAQAMELRNSLRAGVPVVASARLRADVQVRLALGKDAGSSAALLARALPPLRVADAAGGGAER